MKRWLAILGSIAIGATSTLADTLATGFDTANKLYEEGKFAEAIPNYLQLLNDGRAAPAIYFNLGNAYFKSGQKGRAIISYLRAERLAPRDPDIRANLQFVRDSIAAGESTAATPWPRIFSWLTLGELSAVAAVCGWLWFGLLGLGQLLPAIAPRIRLPVRLSAVGCVLALGWFAAAARGELSARHGVVVTPEAVVRLGPLEESRSSHSLRDGSEVSILEQRQDWLRVHDGQGRIGWLRSSQIATLDPTRLLLEPG